MTYFGTLLTVDAWGCPKKLVNSVKVVEEFQYKAAELGEMTILAGPITFPYKHPRLPKESGVSSNVIFVDSHSAVHTFVNDGHVFFDFFTCKTLDVKATLALLEATFKPEELEYTVQKRGKNYKR